MLRLLTVIGLISCAASLSLAEATRTKTNSPAAIAGEYSGDVLNEAGGTTKVGVQIAASGAEKYVAIGYLGGLPGDGWTGSRPVESSGQLKNGKIHFKGDIADVVYDGGTLTVIENGGKIEIGTLEKVTRQSPTLSIAPPEKGTLLLDGKSADLLPNGQGRLHLEFQIASQPSADSLSGSLKIGNELVLRIADSFCRLASATSCGALSGQPPLVNAGYPTGAWQTLDIDFGASTVNVKLNGTLIHQDVKWSPKDGTPLTWEGDQNIQLRNIWFEAKTN